MHSSWFILISKEEEMNHGDTEITEKDEDEDKTSVLWLSNTLV